MALILFLGIWASGVQEYRRQVLICSSKGAPPARGWVRGRSSPHPRTLDLHRRSKTVQRRQTYRKVQESTLRWYIAAHVQLMYIIVQVQKYSTLMYSSCTAHRTARRIVHESS